MYRACIFLDKDLQRPDAIWLGMTLLVESEPQTRWCPRGPFYGSTKSCSTQPSAPGICRWICRHSEHSTRLRSGGCGGWIKFRVLNPESLQQQSRPVGYWRGVSLHLPCFSWCPRSLVQVEEGPSLAENGMPSGKPCRAGLGRNGLEIVSSVTLVPSIAPRGVEQLVSSAGTW